MGHETPRDPDPDLVNNTGAAGEVEVGRLVGRALVARLKADPRFRPRLIPGQVPSDIQDRSFPVDAFIALHCDGAANPSAEGWSLGFPPDPVNKRLAQRIGRQFKTFHRSDRRPDNNTAGMADYYGYRRVPTSGPEVLVEHGLCRIPENGSGSMTTPVVWRTRSTVLCLPISDSRRSMGLIRGLSARGADQQQPRRPVRFARPADHR